MLTRNGTEGRVYGGDCNLIHIQDGQRTAMGAAVASFLDAEMRARAFEARTRTAEQAYQQFLCPGCVMVALFNAAVILANQNGQPLSELGATMSKAFAMLAARGDFDRPDEAPTMEEIHVVLD